MTKVFAQRNESGNAIISVLMGMSILIAFGGAGLSMMSLKQIQENDKQMTAVASAYDKWSDSHPEQEIPVTDGYVPYGNLKSVIASKNPELTVSLNSGGSQMVKISRTDGSKHGYQICSYTSPSGSYYDDDDIAAPSPYKIYDASSSRLISAEPSACK